MTEAANSEFDSHMNTIKNIINETRSGITNTFMEVDSKT